MTLEQIYKTYKHGGSLSCLIEKEGVEKVRKALIKIGGKQFTLPRALK